ncbi:MAG TPA: phosphate ABC transporter substrate-binding protein PstS family protein [Planctomycetes bacterium]|nr:phosphate ABC transporter substrate-binding protein PstS family protein [Planctomycetota bacterium]
MNLAAYIGLISLGGASLLTAQAGTVPAQGTRTKVNPPRKGPIQVDPKLPNYKKTSGIHGELSSIGSDTLNNLMTLWAEGFSKLYPGVKIQIEGKGSSTAPPALIAGAAQLGPMSRMMKSKELDRFEKKFGYKPTRIPVAIDALSVYINKDNPLEKLTLQQVDAIFSKTRRGGYPKDITRWGQLGLGGPWANRMIRVYGRNSISGTYGYFKKRALFKGDFKDSVKEQPGSASVVRSVGEDLYGIGYSGIGYRTSDVKLLALAKKKGKPFYAPTPKNIYAGKYPLARFLFIYLNKAPNKPLQPLVAEFLKFVLSKEGQKVVLKDGYLPLPAPIAAKALKPANL